MRAILLVLVLLLPALANAGDCTYGAGDTTDCLCNRLANASDPMYRSDLRWCEDFEKPTYYATHASGDWVYWNGGSSGNCGNTLTGGNERGCSSDWVTTYGQAKTFARIGIGAPASPYVGLTCSIDPSYQACAGIKEYCSANQGTVNGINQSDCWGAGINATAALDVQRHGDTTDASETTTLTGGIGLGGSDVGDGKQHMALRVVSGLGGPGGDVGGRIGASAFTNITDEMGITQLVAYNSSLASTGILAAPWKQDEFGRGDDENASGNATQGFFLANTQASGGVDPTTFPLHPFFWVLTAQAGNCTSIKNAMSVTKGSCACASGGLSIHCEPSTSDYTQAGSWPYGTWGCPTAHYTGITSSNMGFEMKFNDTTVIQFTGLDGTKMRHHNGVNGFIFNIYSNANESGGIADTTSTAVRYVDDFVITAGPPVSCADIGFVGGAPASPGKMMWRRGASLGWPLPYLTASYWLDAGRRARL